MQGYQNHEIMQFKKKFQIYYLISVFMGPVYVPVARNHEEMAVSPNVNFLFLQLFSFMEAGYDTCVFLSIFKILLCLQPLSIRNLKLMQTIFLNEILHDKSLNSHA